MSLAGREREERPPEKAPRKAFLKKDGSRDPVAARSPGLAPPAGPPTDDPRGLVARLPDSYHHAENAAELQELQRTHGNQYVQRLLSGESSGTAAVPRLDVPGERLDPPVQRDMEGRFGTSLDGVRIHRDPTAGEASRALGARAFTTGQDIYFAPGAYRPETPEGKGLLAHELTHTLQQRRQRPGTQGYLEILPPNDPLEEQAHRTARQITAGPPGTSPPPAVTPAPTGALPAQRQIVQRQPEGESPPPASGETPGASGGPTGLQENGDFVIELGGGFKIRKDEMQAAVRKGHYDKDLSSIALPGLKLKNLRVNLDRTKGRVKGGEIRADLAIPFVKTSGGGLRAAIEEDGTTELSLKAKLDVAALNHPEVNLSLKKGQVSGDLTLAANDLKFRGLPRLKIPSASVTVGIDKGKLFGKGDATLEYKGLAKGAFSVDFKEGVPSGKGRIELTPDYLKGVEAGLAISEGNLEADLTIPASKLSPPVPGLSITEGSITVGMKNGQLSGKGEGIKFNYQSLGSGTLSFSLSKDHLEGRGGLELTIPGLTPVKGELHYRDGALSGRATLTADKFPKSLPIRGGSITVGVDEKAAISGKGTLGVNLFGVGEGKLGLGYEKGILDISAEIELRKIPTLESGRVKIGLKDGKLEGEGEIAVAPKQVPGLSGSLLVVYKEDRFSGKAKLGYARDKFSGQVELFLAQTDKGKLEVSGSGEVTARLTDWLTGKVHIDVAPDATTKIAGQLKADDIELFPAKKADRELFSISQNIPLWAILVAVFRLRGGVRAGVGPGMLRGVTAEGTFSTEPGVEPTFSVTGELYIPAYAEAYLAIGVGLGLDVVIGSLTGGIEAVGTAGIYGAVSVIPLIEYDGSNFSISGTATLAAGAKLKLGLQAWAEVEAFWITVWENTWNLAEWVWDVGPELAMQANMKYVFGRPEPPTFEFKTSDIDAHRLISDAMPKDGPKGSGAREALKNSAEWKGQLKEARSKDASAIPAELADKSAKSPVPKAPPPRPTSPKGPVDAKSKDPAKTKEMLAKELKEGASPDKSKAADPAHDAKAAAGMAALEAYVAGTKTSHKDSQEIIKELDALKTKYGFATFKYHREGDNEVIEAGFSPVHTFTAKINRLREDIEGKHGTYSGLRGLGETGDRITPDHQPQDRLMRYVAHELKDGSTLLFAGTNVANYTRDDGSSLNLDQDRHYNTLSYGSPPDAAIQEIKDAMDGLRSNASVASKRKAVAKVVDRTLKDDQAQVRKIFNTPSMSPGVAPAPQAVKNRALNQGLPGVRTLNETRYPEAFDY